VRGRRLLADRPDEAEIQRNLEAIYGPKAFHYAQATESILHWPEQEQP
jgi:hypothetical protein